MLDRSTERTLASLKRAIARIKAQGKATADVRGPLPMPPTLKVGEAVFPMFARAVDVEPTAGRVPLTARQVQALEQLVLDEVRATLALNKIAALCETRNRAVIAVASAIAGFDLINVRASSSRGPGAGS